MSSAQLETARAALSRAQEALGVQLGSDVPLDVIDQEPTLESPPRVTDALSTLEGARSDVRAAKVRTETSQASTRLDWMDYVPLLNVVFQPFYQNPPSLTQPLTGWQLNVVLQLPLYDGGARYAQAKDRRAQPRSTR